MILYKAADLLWATRIKATAESLSLQARPARTPEMLDARLADSDVRLLIVDLDTEEEGVALIAHARAAASARGQRVRILAFGPHVREDLFEAAREAGADQALARGAFDRRLGEILMSANV